MADLKARAIALYKEKKYDESIEVFNEAIALAPEDSKLYANRCAVFTAAARFDEAVSDADKVIELEPDWVRGYSRKGNALLRSGKLEEASALYEEASAKFPEDSSIIDGKKILEAKMQESTNALMRQMQEMFSNLETRARAHPNLSKYCSDPEYIKILREAEGNPQALIGKMQDPRISETLTTLMGLPTGMGGMPPPSSNPYSPMSTPSMSSPSSAAPSHHSVHKEEEVKKEEEEEEEESS
eukprot:gnl/Carplike_NY0171/573_a781_3384.p1 GENE.gnl/Carplike_NY0171/573_a781_3384~~gnl/Carplike_NY0171/573_a781_3384.p1  ORF type:complete len:241 (-),score=95.29 gnl/Carplike_NY0171/573_a781_3384:85-807(-)